MRALSLSPLLLLACLTGCGDAAPPRWLDLTAGLANSHWYSVEAQPSERKPESRSTRLVSSADASWLEIDIARSDWQPHRVRDTWACELEMNLAGPLGRLAENFRLECAERSFLPAETRNDEGSKRSAPTRWSYILTGNSVLLRLDKDEEPPARTVLSVRIRKQERTDPDRIKGARFSGRGILTWPGEGLRMHTPVPAQSTLRFATTVDPLFRGEVAATSAPAVTFRVLIDGEVRFEHSEPSTTQATSAWHELALPEGGLDSAQIDFEVSGQPAYTSFFSPVIGPSEIGESSNRPWGPDRPDIVIFLADTFRADNLAVYGGKPEVAPELNRLVPDSLCFKRSWSVSTYTLPSHTSLFSGIFPRQAGIGSMKRALPKDLPTLAEFLSVNGYRTGAITDSGAVSKDFGFAKGFDWFDEHQSTIAATLDRARDFLDADDGRPVFLFVQSYRVHRPYHGPLIDPGESPLFGGADAFRSIEAELVALAHDKGFPKTKEAWHLPDQLAGITEAEAAMVQLETQYRSGVGALDEAFGRFHADVTARGMLREGCLIFTSDHGESFGEHGSLYHGNRVFDEETRIPLLLFSDRLPNEIVEYGASLVDIAPTIANLVGLAPLDAWVGDSLIRLQRDRPIFSFQCKGHEGSTLSVVEGNRKVISFEDPERLAGGDIYGAFELDLDPGEQATSSAEREIWAKELLERLTPALQVCLEPTVDASASNLSDDKTEELRLLGYAE